MPRLAVLPFRFHAPHRAPGAMDSRIKRFVAERIFDSLEDHRLLMREDGGRRIIKLRDL